MVDVRPELSLTSNVFLVTAQGYAADHWYGWLPKAFNAHPEIFALLAHEGSRPKYFKERTRGERPFLPDFIDFLNDMGMTYQAIGDFYSYRAYQLPILVAHGRELPPCVNIVRHPYAWLEFYVRWRAGNMRMPAGKSDPLEWEWKIANHKLFGELGLRPYGRQDVEIWATYQGMHMLNLTLRDAHSGIPQLRLEQIVSNPETFAALVRFLTGQRCEFSTRLLDQVYESVNIPFRGEAPIRAVPRELYEAWPEWKREALPKLLSEEARELYIRFGYRLHW